jgi:Fe2+ or Zn2+ uptake regulation protein
VRVRKRQPSRQSVDHTEQPATLVSSLREHHQRLTAERTIAARLIAVKTHAFTGAMLVEELRPHGISRSTAYRTLQLLERMQVLTHIMLDGRRGYVVCNAAAHHYHLTRGASLWCTWTRPR